MLNEVIIMGRLTTTPELKQTQSGKNVIAFTIACDRDFGEKETDFINCVAFGNQAKSICNYFGKGRLLLVVGSLQSRQFTTQNNEKRTVFEVNVEEVHFTGEKKETQQTAQNAPYQADEDVFEPLTDDEEFPF